MLKNRQKSDFDDFLDCIIIESVHNPNPSASGFDRLAPKSPHSSAPAPPDRNRWPRGRLARAREKRKENG